MNKNSVFYAVIAMTANVAAVVISRKIIAVMIHRYENTILRHFPDIAEFAWRRLFPALPWVPACLLFVLLLLLWWRKTAVVLLHWSHLVLVISIVLLAISGLSLSIPVSGERNTFSEIMRYGETLRAQVSAQQTNSPSAPP